MNVCESPIFASENNSIAKNLHLQKIYFCTQKMHTCMTLFTYALKASGLYLVLNTITERPPLNSLQQPKRMLMMKF